MPVKIVNRHLSILWLAIVFTIFSALLGLIIFQQILFGSDQKGPIWISLLSFLAFSICMWSYYPLEKFMLKLDPSLKFMHSDSGHRLMYSIGALNILFIAGISMSWEMWIVMPLYLGAAASAIRYIPKWDSEILELECANFWHRYRTDSAVEWFIKITFSDRARINCEDCLRLPVY